MKRILLFLLLCAVFLPAPAVYAQTESPPQLDLSLRRDWGYGGLGGQIQGHFTARVRGRDDLVRVTIYLDEQVLVELDASPFEWRFVTDNYPLGKHTLVAVGVTSSGEELRSNTLHVEFVSPQQGWNEAGRMILPLLGVVFGGMLLAAGISWLVERRRGPLPAGAKRSYGLLGGAVCPKCGRPFGLHWWAPNMVAGKFDRCPHCGKWSLVRRASRDELIAAEQAERAALGVMPTTYDEAEERRRALEDSRYLDE